MDTKAINCPRKCTIIFISFYLSVLLHIIHVPLFDLVEVDLSHLNLITRVPSKSELPLN